jgi:hypothetical protein
MDVETVWTSAICGRAPQCGQGATKEAAEQNVEQQGYNATGQTQGQVDSACVTDW